MKNILFVCTGNSARSIIAESIINNEYDDLYKGFSAGSNPKGKINEDVKNYLLSKHMIFQIIDLKILMSLLMVKLKWII